VAAAAAWNLSDGSLSSAPGEPLRFRGDTTARTRSGSHSEYFYLTDRERPGGVLAFDPKEGWFEFLAPVTRDELVWSGTEDAQAGVPRRHRTTSRTAALLEERRGRCALPGGRRSRVSSVPDQTSSSRVTGARNSNQPSFGSNARTPPGRSRSVK